MLLQPIGKSWHHSRHHIPAAHTYNERAIVPTTLVLAISLSWCLRLWTGDGCEAWSSMAIQRQRLVGRGEEGQSDVSVPQLNTIMRSHSLHQKECLGVLELCLRTLSKHSQLSCYFMVVINQLAFAASGVKHFFKLHSIRWCTPAGFLSASTSWCRPFSLKPFSVPIAEASLP